MYPLEGDLRMDNGSQPATRADDTLGNRIDSKLDALENRFERTSNA